MPSATVTSKGQITLPKSVRARLGVKQGDRVAFRDGPDGSIVVEAESVDLLELRGIVRSRRRGVSVEAMADAVRRAGSRR
jgi:antitoxin PrlF